MCRTRNTQSLFPLKDKNDYKSFIKQVIKIIKQVVLVVHVTLVKPSVIKHYNPTEASELSKHLRNNINHCFPWTIIQIFQKMLTSLKT